MDDVETFSQYSLAAFLLDGETRNSVWRAGCGAYQKSSIYVTLTLILTLWLS